MVNIVFAAFIYVLFIALHFALLLIYLLRVYIKISLLLLARTGQANMADHMRRHRVRWLGHAARKPNDVMVKQLLFAHSIPGHPRPLGRPHLTWMDTAMHDMGSLGRMLQIDLPRDWANLALYRDVWRGVVSRC